LREDGREWVLAPENLRRAWQQVKANHGAPGIEGMSLEEFPALAREHGANIGEALREGT
jgi:RNA-directed DNA polymerase